MLFLSKQPESSANTFHENGIAEFVRAIGVEIEFPIRPREYFVIQESTQQFVMAGAGFVSA
jgi:hypothetical protein